MSQKGERDWKGEERAGTVAGRSLGWGDPQRLTLEQLPPFPEVSGNPVHPQIAKLPAWHLFWQSSVCGSLRSGEVGCVGLQVSGSPGGCLGEDWQAGNHTHSTFPCSGRSAASGVGNWKIGASVFI